MKISVVIPALNEEHYLGGILEDLTNQSLHADEIIIVDGESKDKTVEVAHSFEGTRVMSTSPNVASQRDLGCRKAMGDLMILFDADSRLPLNFIEKVSDLYEKHKFEIACPKYQPRDKNLIIRMLFGSLNLIFRLTQRYLPSGGGPCIIVTKDLYNKAGGFDRRYQFDDIEFIRRAGKKGKFMILPIETYISTRRFHKYGVLRTTIKYTSLSLSFMFGRIRATNLVDYEFGQFNNPEERYLEK